MNSVGQVRWWVENAKPGQSIVYHSGPSFFSEDQKPTVCKAFWQLYEQGAVSLTQRKIGHAEYEYIATRR